MKPLIISVMFWVSILSLGSQAHLSACTAFFLKNDAGVGILGKNMDWNTGEGLIYVNKRETTKEALMINPSVHGKPARWTSCYGSVTFNQYGREMPMGGMNEKGLVVEALFLSKTRYPRLDHRPAVRGLQWVQYQLDMSHTVGEVIASDARIRIRPTKSPGHHYLVADRNGDCATIEFIDGKMVWHRGELLPVQALTNNSYAKSLHYWRKGQPPVFDSYDSVWRFLRVGKKLQKYNPGSPAVDYAFEILNTVAKSEFTRWSIVYDIQNRRILFFTSQHQSIQHFDLTTFDFSCATPVKQLDIQAHLVGDVSGQFCDYDYLVNLNLITTVYKRNPYLNDFPSEVLKSMARSPSDIPCIRNISNQFVSQ